jgi:hypothetical protein
MHALHHDHAEAEFERIEHVLDGHAGTILDIVLGVDEDHEFTLTKDQRRMTKGTFVVGPLSRYSFPFTTFIISGKSTPALRTPA